MTFETSDNLPKYFKAISKKNPLTLEEERALAVKIKAGDMAAVHTLVEHNIKIVITIARKHIGQGVPIDDLIQEGNIGLYEAALRFDPKGTARFISYASLWIRKKLNEAVVAHGRIVRLPHNQEYDIYKAKKAGEEVPNYSVVEIDSPIGDEDGSTLGDIILHSSSATESCIEMDHVKFTVRRAINTLKTRDQEIIKAYFGFGEFEPMGTDVIAERFNMTPVRISQIVKSSLAKIKSNL